MSSVEDTQINNVHFSIDQDELTLLLRIVQDLHLKTADIWDSLKNNALVESILSDHAIHRNLKNPTDAYGLSHFHIACMTNHVQAVEFFLNNETSPDQIVNTESLIGPGYSPLHFATRCSSLESSRILLKHGANMHLIAPRGMTPIHILLEQRIKMFDSVILAKEVYKEVILKRIEDNEKIINMFMENNSTNCDSVDNLGLSSFHVACTLSDCSVAECLLDRITDIDQPLNEDSPLYPGYTPLHFAFHCQKDIAKMLITKGANLTTQDAKGVTPLDICIKSFKTEDLINFIASVPTWKDIILSDGKTKLSDYISVLKDFNKFHNQPVDNVNIYVPEDSPLWPGSTLLHLAVILSGSTRVIDELLKRGADFTDQDAHGSSALHVAFRRSDLNVINSMLGYRFEYAANPIDKDNLSHLHIACAMNDLSLVKRLFWIKKIDVNIAYKGRPLAMLKPGWTPLHAATAAGNNAVVRMLLKKGANVAMTDSRGFTPVHLLLGCDIARRQLAGVFFARLKCKDTVVEGLSYLHVACSKNNAKAVKRYLKEGSDIEATIGRVPDENLQAMLVGCRPLHIAMMIGNSDIIRNLLLERGADIFARKADGVSPLSQALDGKYSGHLETFVSLILDSEILQKRMLDELGITMLHVACRTLDVAKVKELLEAGAVDVNAKARDDSNFWAGYTPLHVLASRQDNAQCRGEIFDLLIGAKADVTSMNAHGDTPVHLTLKLDPTVEAYKQTSYLIKHQRDFTVNHENKEGMTHFHAACLVNDFDAIEKFLQHRRINVNKRISSFASRFSDATPFELALDPRSGALISMETQMRVVELLLKNGTKIWLNSRDGYTPLHNAVQCDSSCEKLVRMFVDAGIDINSQAADGTTPFEILLSSNAKVSIEKIEFFVELGCNINGSNLVTGVGYVSFFLSNEKFQEIRHAVLELLTNATDIAALNELSRSAIHNIVTTEDPNIHTKDYVDLIYKLIKLGCSIDQQDKSGKTALFIAAEFKNKPAVKALLLCGADMNVRSSDGISVLRYASENRGPFESVRRCCGVKDTIPKYKWLVVLLANCAKLLQRIGLDVDQHDKSIASSLEWYDFDSDLDYDEDDVDKELAKTKNLKISHSGFKLYDFLSEYKAVISYSYLTQENRNDVDEFFESINYNEFPALEFVLNLQYRKAVERPSLLEPAEAALKELMEFPLPGLCAYTILKFLKRSELRNLIAAIV